MLSWAGVPTVADPLPITGCRRTAQITVKYIVNAGINEAGSLQKAMAKYPAGESDADGVRVHSRRTRPTGARIKVTGLTNSTG